MLRLTILALSVCSASLAWAAPEVLTGVLAVKHPDGYYTYAPAPELDTPAKVLAKSSSFGDKAAQRGLPVFVHPHTTMDEPYVKPSHFPLSGSTLSLNEAHLQSRSEFAWTQGVGTRSIVVAVLDDRLPEFHPALMEAYDKTNAYDVRHSRPYTWLTADDVNDALGEPRTHAVQVAGVIASDYSKTPRIDSALGIAPGVSIMPVTVCCAVDASGKEIRGAADDVAIANGILYAARLPNSSGLLPSRKADAIVASYDLFAGRSAFSQPLAEAIRRAVEAGVLFVTGSGNGGRLDNTEATENEVSALPGVIVVAGTDLPEGTIAQFSTRGTAVDIAASFAAITSNVLFRDGTMLHTSINAGGTSFSGPYVAGLYALAKATYPALTPAIFSEWITADRITFPNEYLEGFDDATGNNRVRRTDVRDRDFGYGIIDAKRTINAALTAAGKPTVSTLPAVTPRLSLGRNNGGFHIYATMDNPYRSGAYLSQMGIRFDWSTSSSSPFPSTTGFSYLTPNFERSLCPDVQEVNGPGFGKEVVRNSSALELAGLSIDPTPNACAVGVFFAHNNYSGPFTVTAKTTSFFAPGGTVTETFTVGSQAVEIASFAASPATVVSGSSTTLSWATTGAQACTLDNRTVPTSGSQTVSPGTNTSYTLNCTGEGQPASRSLLVGVTPMAATPASASASGGGGSASLASLFLLALASLVAARREKAAVRG